jgi:hypothetical protein
MSSVVSLPNRPLLGDASASSGAVSVSVVDVDDVELLDEPLVELPDEEPLVPEVPPDVLLPEDELPLVLEDVELLLLVLLLEAGAAW